VNPNLDPSLVAAINLVGAQMASALYDAGMTGIAHQQTYDLWWTAASARRPRGTTWSASSPRRRARASAHQSRYRSTRCASPAAASTIRALARGTWHLGDIVRYELITSEALVRLAARDA